MRNKIQKIKIDMANEVIDAGRFDMQTSMAERKETLESMLQACIHPSISMLVHHAPRVSSAPVSVLIDPRCAPVHSLRSMCKNASSDRPDCLPDQAFLRLVVAINST